MSESPPPIRAVVFDLDDTLYDCLRQCVAPAHREAAKAMVEAGLKATPDEVLEARLALSGVHALDLDDAVAATFRSVNPLRVAEAGRRAFYERDPGPLEPYPFARDVVAKTRSVAKAVLLSTGHPATQRKKIEALGLASAFDEILLDDVFDVSMKPSKEDALSTWLSRSGFAPGEVLVVGDRPDSEIAAALRLGMRALRIRGGELASRATPPGVPEADDVRAILAWLGAPPETTGQAGAS